MVKSIFVVFFILILSLIGIGQKKTWQIQMEKIRPLFTTESEVELILGTPVKSYANIREYETKEGLFTITYSLGNCQSARVPAYNIKKGVVEEYDFRPRKKFKFNSLKLDLAGFTSDESSDNPDATVASVEYDNLDKGITYTKGNRLLNWVQVYPGNYLDYLQCIK